MTSSPQESDLHKKDVLTLENIESNEKAGEIVDYSPEELRKVVRKLDFNLMPLCFLLYTFSVLDVSSGIKF